MGGNARAGRRTQAERTATTQAALLDATVDSLVDLGYAGTTTVEVTRRAGVSAGALLHHYPSKSDLLIAAVEHLCDRRLEEYRKAMANLDPGADRVDASLDLLWACLSGREFVAWTELWIGSRTDADLSAAVVAMNKRFIDHSQELFAELFPPGDSAATSDFYEFGLALPFALMDGLALSRFHAPYEPYPSEQLIEVLKLMSRLVFPR